MAKDQNLKNLQKFSQNLRRTRLGVEFSKRLFTNPSSISNDQIANVMRALGYDVPKEIKMAADAAQVIVAGQAIKDGIDAYETFNDIQSLTETTATSVRTIAAIAERNDLMDKDTAGVARLGANVGMLVASCGTDVRSWVDLALQVTEVVASNQQLANYRALCDAQVKFRDRLNPQISAMTDIQIGLAKGDLSTFGMIAKLAVDAPDLWPQYINKDTQLGQLFPDLLTLPITDSAVVGYGESKIWGNLPFGGSYTIASWSSARGIDFKTLGKKFTKELAADFLFNLYVAPWVNVYSAVNNEIVLKGNMTIDNIAAISYLSYGANSEISDKTDYVKLLLATHLTPYDLDDLILDDISKKYVDSFYKDKDTNFYEQAISFSINPRNTGFNNLNKDQEKMRLSLLRVKQTDDIVELVQYPYIYKKLQSYMDFEETSFEKNKTLESEKLVKVFGQPKDLRSWRKINNYIATLQLLDTFRNDSYLKNTKYAEMLLPFMPSIDSFDKKIVRLNELSMARNINALALSNVAEFLGTSSDKLVKVNNGAVGAAIYTVKG